MTAKVKFFPATLRHLDLSFGINDLVTVVYRLGGVRKSAWQRRSVHSYVPLGIFHGLSLRSGTTLLGS
jgi:hypothetical protein